MTHGWATQAKMWKKCCYGLRNLGQYCSLSLSPAHLSHTTNITLLRIKCERYIFIKKCIHSFIEVGKLYLIMFPLIFVLWLYNRSNIEHCLQWHLFHGMVSFMFQKTPWSSLLTAETETFSLQEKQYASTPWIVFLIQAHCGTPMFSLFVNIYFY